MNTFTNAAMPLKLFGAVLALALIAVAALVVTPSQAEGTDGTPTPTPTPSPYAAPGPCGPIPLNSNLAEFIGTAHMEEPHERTTGHYALFDTYWEATEPDPAQTPGLDGEQGNAGLLNTNTCPPYVSQTTETDPNDDSGVKKITVTNYSASGVDIDELIIHVTDLRKVQVVATNAAAGQLALDRYPGLREALELGEDDAVPAGTEVWWLRTDDPSTADVDESAVDDPDTTEDETTAAHSNGLSVGFSTRHLDPQDWGVDPYGGAPLHYAFEVERHPGIDPADHPHVLNYRIDHSGANNPEEIWNSIRVHRTPLKMKPGEYESLEWIFTKPGTYEIWAHLIGWVNDDASADAGPDWEPISANDTETSDVQRYVFQVGDELLENEPPVFGANRTVPENSLPGAPVGAPIPIFEGEADTFYYTLSGEGADQFVLEPTTDPLGVQVKIAPGPSDPYVSKARLDYETQDSYDLMLTVTDKIDHESNVDLSIDDTLPVRIAVEDVVYGVVLTANDNNPQVGNGVVVTALRERPAGSSTPVLTWHKKINDGDWEVSMYGSEPFRGSQATVHRWVDDGPGSMTLKVEMDVGEVSVWSNEITVTWHEAQQ